MDSNQSGGAFLGPKIWDKTLNFNASGNSVTISTEYVIPVNLPFYSYDWTVQHEVKRRLFKGF